MPLRYVIALLLLIVAPLIVIGWLGTSVLRRQQQQQRQQLQVALTQRLVEFDQDLQAVARAYEADLQRELKAAGRDKELLRSIGHKNPTVRTALLVDRDGRLIFPAKPVTDVAKSLVWHAALTQLARNRPVADDQESSSSSPLGKRAIPFNGQKSEPPVEPRWQTWYHEGGLQLVLWMPGNQAATGVVLERGRWMADLISVLPEDAIVSESFSLRDSEDRVVYHWGRLKDDDAIDVLADLRVSSPWNAWRLTFEVPRSIGQDWMVSGVAPLLASLIAVGIAVALLGIYVLTSTRRQMNLAGQRVSFAGHVSHELRTPLTNIRLYADLARRDLQKAKPNDHVARAEQRIHVIEQESQRLSRIVSSVLDMVSGKGRLHPVHRAPDDVIRRVLTGFQPAMDELGLQVHTDLHAADEVSLDEDVVELVLVNLLSNVEKYASGGKCVRVRSRQDGPLTVITVADDGPGITKKSTKKIFEPFLRLDDSLQAPAGTGLGLAIARSAARRHGGDLVLAASSDVDGDTKGAHFCFTFQDADAHEMSREQA